MGRNPSICKQQKLILILFFVIFSSKSFSQNFALPYNFQQSNLFSEVIYSDSTAQHTTIKPLYSNDLGGMTVIDSIKDLAYFGPKRFKNKILKHFLERHQVEVKTQDYSFNFDFIPDWQFGKEFTGKQNSTYLNSRGFFINGNIGKYFTFNSELIANLALFPEYFTTKVEAMGVIPGFGHRRFLTNATSYDFDYSTGSILYTPSKFFTFQLGHGKNFIGDGYRSMILSDQAFNYPFFKVVTNFWKIKYMNLFAQFQDLKSPRLSPPSSYNLYRKKYGAFHYLDLAVNKNLSIGLFEAIIWNDQDSFNKRGFDVNYLNPVILYRPIEYSLGSPDNALLGISGKYKLPFGITIYGQFNLDELKISEYIKNRGWWANKYGLQAGLKGFKNFNRLRINYLAEYNTAPPYTFSHGTSITNYGHYNEGLTHPLGANFKERVGQIQINYCRFELFMQYNFAKYGLDSLGNNMGKDIYKSYETHLREYGNYTGQGIATNLNFYQIKISYLVNPKIDLKFEMGYVGRKETNALGNLQTSLITFGLRGSFRNFYQDF